MNEKYYLKKTITIYYLPFWVKRKRNYLKENTIKSINTIKFLQDVS